MTNLRTIIGDLAFPEGPVELADGSIAVVELRAQRVRRISRDGSSTVLATTGGGPNGMAPGPGGLLYIANNGGSHFPPGKIHSTGPAHDYAGGSIQTLDPHSGEVRTLYTEYQGRALSSPNDLVFDSSGGFYFTDTGKRLAHHRPHGGIYYAAADGSSIVEVIYPLITPNGVGLSPDEGLLYFSETETGRLWSFELAAPGVVSRAEFPSPRDSAGITAPNGATLVHGFGDFVRCDSFAIDSEGNIVLGTLGVGELVVVAPSGSIVRRIVMPDLNVTNVCFGGQDLRTAFVTVSISTSGKLVELEWPVPGHRINFAM